jgi:outer membrane murein-binding lipoprotein Lpp
MLIAAVLAALAIAGCSSVSEKATELRERASDIEFDLDATLDQVRDCDGMSELFVSAVRTAAVSVDSLAKRTNGRVPAPEIEELVDKVSVSDYYDLGAKLGCARVQMRLTTIEQLRSLQDQTQTPAGDDFLEELMQQLEQSQ